MSEVDCLALGLELLEAQQSRQPIEPLTSRHPDLTPFEAYQVQQVTIRERTAAGSIIRGHKVGLTSKVMQQQFGIDEPDYGHLLSDMFEYEATEVPVSAFISPRVEIEPAFVLGRPLCGPGLTVADIIRATDYVLPSLEIIDSRIRDWDIRLADTIADNGSSAGVVLGGRPVRLTTFDPRDLDCTLSIDGEVRERSNTRAILGNPITAVTWLANKLGEQGVALDEGHVVLPGTCVRALPVSAGSAVRGVFDVLGEVSLQFV